MIYNCRESLTLKEVKANLSCKEKVDKELTGGSKNQVGNFSVKGREIEWDYKGNKNRFRRKSKNRDKVFNYCHKKGT